MCTLSCRSSQILAPSKPEFPKMSDSFVKSEEVELPGTIDWDDYAWWHRATAQRQGWLAQGATMQKFEDQCSSFEHAMELQKRKQSQGRIRQ